MPDTCDHCGRALEPPTSPGPKQRFCPGSKCRSAWHALRKRRAAAEALAALERALLDLGVGHRSPLRPLSAREEVQTAIERLRLLVPK